MGHGMGEVDLLLATPPPANDQVTGSHGGLRFLAINESRFQSRIKKSKSKNRNFKCQNKKEIYVDCFLYHSNNLRNVGEKTIFNKLPYPY